MKSLAELTSPIVLRTDYSDDTAWQTIIEEIESPVGDMPAPFTYVSDPAYDGISTEDAMTLIPRGSETTYLFIVDHMALTHPLHPILVLDLYEEPDDDANYGRSFRAEAITIKGIEISFSAGNLDFHDFIGEWTDYSILHFLSDAIYPAYLRPAKQRKKPLTNPFAPVVLRTDFSDEAAWQAVIAEIEASIGDLEKPFSFISDPVYEGASVNEVLELIPQGLRYFHLFIVDQFAVRHKLHLLLVVHRRIHGHAITIHSFRALPGVIKDMEINLSIGNMSIEDFVANLDNDGVLYH